MSTNPNSAPEPIMLTTVAAKNRCSAGLNERKPGVDTPRRVGEPMREPAVDCAQPRSGGRGARGADHRAVAIDRLEVGEVGEADHDVVDARLDVALRAGDVLLDRARVDGSGVALGRRPRWASG